GGDVGAGAGADQGAEMELEVLAELQPAIGMRQGQGALDVVGDGLAGGVGEIVERQDDDGIAHAHPAVLTAIPHEVERAAVALARHFRRSLCDRLRFRFRHGYHLFVFMLWMCACLPLPIGAVAIPISYPYFRTVSPFLMSLSATLWPSGTSS